MRKLTWLAAVSTCLFVGPACKKKDDAAAKPAAAGSAAAARPGDKPAPAPTDKPADQATTDAPATAGSGAGVEAGGIARDAEEGPAGVLTKIDGTVEIRRLGEAEFAAAKPDDALYAGDQLRTGEHSTASVVLADESVMEVAEVSTVALSSRETAADPASGAAVLAGLARFTVTPRAPGEGAFTVFTPSAVVLTKGTTYAVGVAASGEARVGVEAGEVETLALVDLATPVAVTAGNAATVEVAGGATVAPWPTDDWGTWRDEADASLQVDASIDAHGQALAELDTTLTTLYADLDTELAAAATFEAAASASADGNVAADYQAAAPAGALAIDASFGLAGAIEAYTWAHAAHATLATDLYVRHPDKAKATWTVVAPRVDAAILWPKRFSLTAEAQLVPLRGQYYLHHPRGRAHAAVVGVEVPAFYAAVVVPPPPRAEVEAKIKIKTWTPPSLIVKAQARPVWIAAPAPTWRANVKVVAAPPRAKVAWYVRPPQLKASTLIGVKATGRWTTALKIGAPAPRATLAAKLAFRPIGTKITVKKPDLAAAAKARMGVKLDGNGRMVHAGGWGAGGAVVVPGVDIKGPGKPGVDVKIGVGIGIDVDVKGGGVVKGKPGAGGGSVVDHRTKTPEPPKGKGKGKGGITVKGGAGIKIGK
jgi:hypothetical protein